MLINYIKLAVRNLVKHKTYTLISLFGLVAGITSALVLILYAYQELTFDSVHINRERSFLVYKERTTPNGTQLVYDTWVPMLDVLKDEYPEITQGARLLNLQGFLNIGDKKLSEQVFFADPELFKVFNLPTAQGDGYHILMNKSNVIVSPAMATKLFGKDDPIGKPIRILMNGVAFELTIAAVLEEIPANSSVRPDIIVPFDHALDLSWVAQAEWNSSFLLTFILMEDLRHAAKLESKFPALVKKVFDEETAGRMKFKLLSLANHHNHLNDSNKTAYIMLCIAFIIILIAVVNYINLATVRSIERAKEIGLRKVLGASRIGLIKQFLSESLALTALAFAGSIILLQLLLPYVNDLLETTIDFNINFNPALPLICLGIFFLVGLSSGSFPAIFISRYKAVESIKGKWKSTPLGSGIKQTLIVFQFALSVILLFCTMVIYRQVNFMKDHEIGLNRENVLVIPTDTDNMMDPQGARNRITTLKKELLQHSQIKQVSSSSLVPSDLTQVSYTMVRPDGWTEEQPFRIMRVTVDETYFDLYEVKILEGENFNENISPLDTMVRNFAIVNEAAMHAFGWKDIEGKKISPRTQVVGLVQNHHYDNLARAVQPIVFIYRTSENQSSSFISVRLQGHPSGVLPMIEQKWRTLDESRPFSYFFVDSSFDDLYKADVRNMRIITWFSALAIVIACMGLLGLISFTVNQKVKEIGIRKVLGSSDTNIVLLLNKEFVVLITIAVVIALPLGHYIMKGWLSDFAIQTDLHWSIFAIVAVATFSIAILTTSFRIWKAANANPIESLRTE
ncbi:MAG: FtsX-like permease family protein [Bacteroidota bacterium]